MVPNDIILNEHEFIYCDILSRNRHAFVQSNVHYHNYYELFYLEYGECNYTIENDIFKLRSNQLVIVSPLTMHITSYEQKSTRKIISFSADFIAPVFIKYLSKNQNPYVFYNDKSRNLLESLDNIIKELQSPDAFSKQATQSYLTIMLKHILRFQSDPSYFINDIEGHTSVYTMLNYIQSNYQNDISLKDLSDLLGYTPNYVSKLFSNTIGMSFKKYLFLQRIKTAESLLLNSDIPITEISYAVGFNDSNYFSTAFKNKYGITPSEYRKNSKIHKN